jgi:hypothetical protein
MIYARDCDFVSMNKMSNDRALSNIFLIVVGFRVKSSDVRHFSHFEMTIVMCLFIRESLSKEVSDDVEQLKFLEEYQSRIAAQPEL